MSSWHWQMLPKIPLDPSLYNLQGSALAFFKAQTGIRDDDELKKHILSVQAEAYAVHPYPCIRILAFTWLTISQYPIYETVIKIGKDRPDAILLDLGCCFGNDTRKAIADGYPCGSIIASDLRPDFWELGHKLFCSSKETFPVPFIAGDIFNPEFLAPNVPPAPPSSSPPTPAPPLTSVTSLTQLQHHICVIHTSAFFHLFTETQQRALAHLLGSLLSPLPGSIIFGSHLAFPETEENQEGGTVRSPSGATMFGHCPSSWEKLWVGDGGVFQPGDVILSTKAVEVDKKAAIDISGDPTYIDFNILAWSVMRA